MTEQKRKASLQEILKLRMQEQEFVDQMRAYSIKTIHQAMADGLSPTMTAVNMAVTCSIVAKVADIPLRELVAAFVALAEETYAGELGKNIPIQ
jgi:hypothetical protein